MRDPVVVDRLKAETIQDRHAKWASIVEAELATKRSHIKNLTADRIKYMLPSDAADLMCDLSRDQLAAIFRFLFNHFMPGTLGDNGYNMACNEQAVSNAVFALFWQQFDLERDEHCERRMQELVDEHDLEMERIR